MLDILSLPVIKAFVLFAVLFGSFFCVVSNTNAQAKPTSPSPVAASGPETDEATSSSTVETSQDSVDVTKPEESPEKQEFLQLFSKRQVQTLKAYNFMPYYVQKSVEAGVPANTVILILLLPLLSTLVAFARQVIGVPTLEMLVPIAFSAALVSTGLAAGTILLITILMATAASRLLLKRVKIMQVPRKSLTILIVAFFVFVALFVSAANGLIAVTQLSIFPILIIILLGEKIISVQLTRNLSETVTIVSVTILLSLGGYFLLTWPFLRQAVLLYPEFIFLLIPLNLALGRYFGLRVSEFVRFSSLIRHGNS